MQIVNQRPMDLRGRCYPQLVHPSTRPGTITENVVANEARELFTSIVSGQEILYLGTKSSAPEGIVMDKHPLGEDASVVVVRGKITGIQKIWFFAASDYFLFCALVDYCAANGFGEPVPRTVQSRLEAFHRLGNCAHPIAGLEPSDGSVAIYLSDLPKVMAMVAIGERNINVLQIVEMSAAALKVKVDEALKRAKSK